MIKISAYRPVAFLAFTLSVCNAQLFQARLTTFGYAWQRSDTVGQSTSHLFGYQSGQLSLSEGNYSVSTYLQGFTDYGGPLKSIGSYRLYNLFVRARNLADLFDVTVGRQATYSGVGTGTFDGISGIARFADGLVNLNGFYGFLPAPGYKAELIGDKANNFTTGAQVTIRPNESLRAAVNFSARQILPETYTAIRADSMFNPSVVEIRPSAMKEEYIGGDIDYAVASLGSVFARLDYDLVSEKSSRIELFVRALPVENLALTALYLTREPRISFNSIFSVFAYNTISEYEGGVEYTLDQNSFIFARLGSVSYGDDNATRVSVGYNTKFVSASLAHNVGPESRLSSVSANAGYPMMDGQVTPTVNAGYALYKFSESADLTGAMNLGVGAVYRPFPALAVDSQVMLLTNAWYQQDVRLSLRATYLISERLGIF